jgi:hypothetical protein
MDWKNLQEFVLRKWGNYYGVSATLPEYADPRLQPSNMLTPPQHNKKASARARAEAYY